MLPAAPKFPRLQVKDPDLDRVEDLIRQTIDRLSAWTITNFFAPGSGGGPGGGGGVTAGIYDRVGVAASGLVTTGYPMVVANIAALQALPGANYRDGSAVRVRSLERDFYLHTTSAATVDGIGIASVFGMAGARWIGREFGLRYWWEQITWYINPATGSDEATGAVGAPVKTFAEVRRRMFGRVVPTTANVTVNLLGDLPDTDPISLSMGTAGFATLTVNGQQTVLASGTISAHTAASRISGGNRNRITVALSVGNLGDHIGKMIRLQGTTTTTAVIEKYLGANQAELSEQTIGIAFGAGFTTGQAIDVISCTKAAGVFMGTGMTGVTVDSVDFNPTGAVRILGDITRVTAQFRRCRFRGTVDGSVVIRNFDCYGCCFQTRGTLVSAPVTLGQPAFVDMSGVGFKVDRGGTSSIESATFQNSILTIGDDTVVHVGGGGASAIGFFDLTAGKIAVSVALGSIFDEAAAFWGTGNSVTSVAIELFSYSQLLTTNAIHVGNYVADMGIPLRVGGEVIPLTSLQRIVGVYRHGYGPSVASASAIAPVGPTAFEGWPVTGTTAINHISAAFDPSYTRYDVGDAIELEFVSGLTVNGGVAAPPAGYLPITLLTGTSVAMPAGSRMRLRLTTSNGGPSGTPTAWVEIWRSVATGVVTAVTASPPLASSGGVTPNITLTDGDWGDIVTSGGGIVWTIDTNVVTDNKLRQALGNSVIGRTTGTVGNVADIQAFADGEVFRMAGGLLGWGAIPVASVTGAQATMSAADGTVNFPTATTIRRTAISGDVSIPAASNASVVNAITTTTGPLSLVIGAIADGEFLKRVGATIVGAAAGGGTNYQTIQNAGVALTQRAIWNASTGLTAVDNPGSVRTDVTVNLSTGIAGGQNAVGGTGASESLGLVTTTHGTKGFVRQASWWELDETNSRMNVIQGAFASWNTGTGTDFERVRQFWNANVWTLKSEKGGTGTVRPILIDSDTAGMSVIGATTTVSASTGNLTLVGGSASGSVVTVAGGTTRQTVTSAGEVQINAGATESWYNVAGANFSRVQAVFGISSTLGTDTWQLLSEQGGSGTLPNAILDAGAANAGLKGAGVIVVGQTGAYSADFTAISTAGIEQAILRADRVTRVSGAAATLDAITILVNDVDISGTTTILTATGFNAINVARPTYNQLGAGSVTMDLAATVYIAGAPIAGTDVTISNGGAFALYINGRVRIDDSEAPSGLGTPIFSFTPGDVNMSRWGFITFDGTRYRIPLWEE